MNKWPSDLHLYSVVSDQVEVQEFSFSPFFFFGIHPGSFLCICDCAATSLQLTVGSNDQGWPRSRETNHIPAVFLSSSSVIFPLQTSQLLYSPLHTLPLRLYTFTIHSSEMVLPTVTYHHGSSCRGILLVTLWYPKRGGRREGVEWDKCAKGGTNELSSVPLVKQC